MPAQEKDMRQRQNQQLPERNAGQQENGTERFASYTQHLAAHTRKRHWRELASLRTFLLQQGSSLGDLAIDAPSWALITTDLINAYLVHLQQRGCQASSITTQLQTIRIYARLAMEAGFVPPEVYQQIALLRISPKGEQEAKGDAVSDLTDEQVQRLLRPSSETWQGQSDQLLLALLLRCGLWPQSIIALDRSSINLADGTITFYQYHAEEQQRTTLFADKGRTAKGG